MLWAPAPPARTPRAHLSRVGPRPLVPALPTHPGGGPLSVPILPTPRAPLASEPPRHLSNSPPTWWLLKHVSTSPLCFQRAGGTRKQLVVNKNPAGSWWSFKGKKAGGSQLLSRPHPQFWPRCRLAQLSIFVLLLSGCFRRQPP